MKIDNYIKTKKSTINEEFIVTPAITFAIYTIIKLIILTVKLVWFYSLKNDIKNAHISENYSKKITDIVGKDIVVKRIKSTKIDVCAGKKALYFTTALESFCTEDEVIAILLYNYSQLISNSNEKIFLSKEGFGTAFDIFCCAIGLIFPYIDTVLLFCSLFIPDIIKNHIEKAKRKKEVEKNDSYVIKMGYGKELVSALQKMERHIRDNIKKQFNVKDADKIESKVKDLEQKYGYSFKSRIDKILGSKEVQHIIEMPGFRSIEALYSVIRKSKFLASA